MKYIGKFITTFSIIILFVPILALAQTEDKPSGLTISPAFSEILPGEKYELKVTNHNERVEQIEIIPMVFSVNGNERRFSLEEGKSDEAKNAINLDRTSATLNPGESTVIIINYTKEIEDYYVGVIVKQSTTRTDQIPLNSQLASIIVKTTLTEEDLANISNELEVKTDVSVDYIGSLLNLGTTYDVKTTITNKSDKILKPSGDITYYLNDKRIDNKQLTSLLIEGIYPDQGIEVEKKFIDDRDFWQRIGKAEFELELRFDENQVESHKTLVALPKEALVIGLVILTTLSISGFSIYRKYLR